MISKMTQISDFVSYSYEAGREILNGKTADLIKEQGQFLTPPPVARYMARQLGAIEQGAHLLEPALGSGVLICAVIERLIAEGQPLEIAEIPSHLIHFNGDRFLGPKPNL